MSKTLIVGGTKGIGLQITQLLDNRDCIIFSRERFNAISPNHIHFQLDVMKDDLPEINEISAIIYCPGTINLKPFRSLKTEDFQNDFNVNFLGAVKLFNIINKFCQKLIMHQLFYLVQLLCHKE